MLRKFVKFLSGIESTTRKYSSGSLIFERDDVVSKVYYVLSGDVHLLRRQLDGVEFILQRAAAGDILGEASLSSSNYHCAAVAVSACELQTFDVVKVRKLIDENGDVAKSYADYLGGELRNARLRAEISFLRKVEDRLSAWLAWHDNVLPPKGDWRRVAAEIGVSPEALYRELARRRKSVSLSIK